jgi:hypothetical protein
MLWSHLLKATLMFASFGEFSNDTHVVRLAQKGNAPQVEEDRGLPSFHHHNIINSNDSFPDIRSHFFMLHE